jgi:sugar (pentulose or hexulose) kinase
MSFIGIDIGASFIKGAVLNTESSSIEYVLRVPFPEFLPNLPPLYREVAIKNIMESVNEVLKRLLDITPNCAGIVVCGQMGGIVLTNNQGEPFSNYISWQDQRAVSLLEVLERRITKMERQHLGNELNHSLPITTLLWLSEKKMLHDIPVSLPDFIVANLCGCSPTTEATNAEAYGIYNIYSHDWDYSVCLKLGLRGLKLPSLRQVGEIVGKFNGIPCYVPIGDQQCALLGAFLQERELSLNISTGCQVSMISKLEFGDYQIRPYFGKYIKTITHIPAGRSLNLLRRLLAEDKYSWDYIDKIVSEISHTDLKVNLSFFASAFGQFGEISNMREDNATAGNIFRAAFDNISDNCYQSALRISKKQEWTYLVFSGGLVQNIGSLRKIIHQKFDTDYRIATVEDTLNGLLIMAQKIGGNR